MQIICQISKINLLYGVVLLCILCYNKRIIHMKEVCAYEA